jgi:hypothetical protein
MLIAVQDNGPEKQPDGFDKQRPVLQQYAWMRIRHAD